MQAEKTVHVDDSENSIYRIRVAHGSNDIFWQKATEIKWFADQPDELAALGVVGDHRWAVRQIYELRERGVCAPILAIRSFADAERAVELLDAGADACIGSDCNLAELAAIVRALNRRGSLRQFRGGVILDEKSRTLHLRGRTFEFGPVAFAVVRHLVDNRERWVSQREIVEVAIGTHYRADSAVARVQIFQIRRTLGDYRRCVKHDGRRGCGYMFTLKELDEEATSGTFPLSGVSRTNTEVL